MLYYSLEYNPEHGQDPSFVRLKAHSHGKFDTDTNSYTTQQDNAFTVDGSASTLYITNQCRHGTSNTNQKLQLLEQILVLFNPALEIQSTDNYLDWTSLSYIELTGTQFSSEPVPAVDESMDIATLSFMVPIYLSAPAKVKKLGCHQ